MSDTMATMGAYIVLAFVAGQFVAYFNETNLGIVLAVNGAELIQGLGFDSGNIFMSILLILVFMLVAGSLTYLSEVLRLNGQLWPQYLYQ